ncbi:MAG TPA: Hsp20/alpha crystallin family protein [Chthonomonadales bacterium]|nr:Hsp20/alpha crystallin family protein [Chthonomonadales bacterium]
MARNGTAGTEVAPRSAGTVKVRHPFEELSEFRRYMDELFARPFGYTPLSRLIPESCAYGEPVLEFHETDDTLFAFAAVPGYAPADIRIDATGNEVRITGKRNALHPVGKEANTGCRLAQEASFEIDYTLPSEIDPNKFSAVIDQGVLRMEMQKTEESRFKSVRVNVNKA